MRVSLLVAVLIGVLAACGSAGEERSSATPTKPTAFACAYSGEQLSRVRADLDGNGSAEEVTYAPAVSRCPASVNATIGPRYRYVVIHDDLSIAPNGLRKVTIPGRTGDLVLLTLAHPRGGFQAHLYGYAGGKLAELTADGKPVFGFLATDAPTEHVSATCTRGGFTVTEARTHQPIGIAAAWDVFRTTYAVDGNDVTRSGDRSEIAENVLEDELPTRYPDLAANRLFAGC
jgi:hypothetical protein